jgi:hypothetical protein
VAAARGAPPVSSIAVSVHEQAHSLIVPLCLRMAYRPSSGAAAGGHTATVAELVRLGARPNGRDRVSARQALRSASVHRARPYLALHAFFFSTTFARQPRVRAQTGWTALTYVAYHGHTATATELVRLGADVNAKDQVRCSLQLRMRGRAGRGVLPDVWLPVMHRS